MIVLQLLKVLMILSEILFLLLPNLLVDSPTLVWFIGYFSSKSKNIAAVNSSNVENNTMSLLPNLDGNSATAAAPSSHSATADLFGVFSSSTTLPTQTLPVEFLFAIFSFYI